MAEHELKTWPEPFGFVALGTKQYEIRKNDRTFRIADTLRLREWDPFTKEYSGREVQVLVTHITPGGEWGLPGDTCVMSIIVIKRHQRATVLASEGGK